MKLKGFFMIKAVLFDMDGVLIDAKDWHFEALNDALKIFGIEISYEDHLRTFDGIPTKEKLKILEKQYYLPSEIHSLINKIKQRNTVTQTVLKCKPTFATEYALSQLKAQGYKIAVCSNSIRSTIELMMNRAALSSYLDLIVSNEDVIKGKPSPEMYLKAMKYFNINPEEALICEDNENGIKAALASGAHLLRIGTVEDTNYQNISQRINEINKGEA